MVLFLFVIMLLNLNKKKEPHKKLYTKLTAIISGGMLFLVLIATAKGVHEIPLNKDFDSQIGLVENFGKVLFNEFMLPFETSSILFLSAIIGAIMLGKKEINE